MVSQNSNMYQERLLLITIKITNKHINQINRYSEEKMVSLQIGLIICKPKSLYLYHSRIPNLKINCRVSYELK